MTEYSVPGPAGSRLSLAVDLDHPLFIVGRNGTGKSALVHLLQRLSPPNSVYLPGSRTALFDGESLSLTPNSRRDLTSHMRAWDGNTDVRWRNVSGNQRNEKAIHDLTVSEQQYLSDCARAIAADSDQTRTTAAITKLRSHESPLDKVNQLLKQSNLPLQMLIVDSELKASSGGRTFSYARMSDGERIALILIAEVIAAKPGTVFLIDEPELHLHRSIVIPLIATVIKSRPDCEFVVSTHELDLPATLTEGRVCIVRSVNWLSTGEIECWDLDVIEHAGDLPEGLYTDILGSRRRVLFTEGTDTSLDVPIYSLLFPKASVRCKGSCKDVQQAVIGIRSTAGLHHTEAFGLVDNDGMTRESVISLQEQSIYPLPFFSMESLYYGADVLAAVASRQAATYEADEAKQSDLSRNYLDDAVAAGVAAAANRGTAEHLAGRLAERQIRDSLLSQLPKREALIAASSPTIVISGASTYPDEIQRFLALLAAKDLHGIIARYPVRHSGILAAVAKALKFQSCNDYEAAAIARLSSDEALREALLRKLVPLSTAINA